jgi:hypothetical protein
MKKLLVGVSALAIGLAASSGAFANPKNTFSNNNQTNLISVAVAGAGAAFSESFNTNLESVSVQTLTASAVGASLSVLSIPIFSGNATVNDLRNNSGITMANANSGNGAVQQQAVSFAAVGEVTID